MPHRAAPGDAAVMTSNTLCAGTYQIDPERSVIAFRTRHLFGLGPVRGTFRLRAGEIRVAEPAGGSAVRATVDADSFTTGNPARDRTVKSGLLLDTGEHPVFTFASSQLTADDDQWTLRGTLVVTGNPLPVELAIEQARADGPELSVLATAAIDRYAFGVTAMKGLAARRLSCQLEIVAVRSDGR
jgi:polyisoprenoid-binding protein YceI